MTDELPKSVIDALHTLLDRKAVVSYRYDQGLRPIIVREENGEMRAREAVLAAIAAHVAAEVAAERARCVAALELAYNAVPKKYDANNRLNHDWTQYDDGVADGLDTAMQIAALPPITPEAL